MFFYVLTTLLGKISSIQKNCSENLIYSIFAPEIFELLSLRLQTVKSLAGRSSYPLSSKPTKILTLASHSDARPQFLICFWCGSPNLFFLSFLPIQIQNLLKALIQSFPFFFFQSFIFESRLLISRLLSAA